MPVFAWSRGWADSVGCTQSSARKDWWISVPLGELLILERRKAGRVGIVGSAAAGGSRDYGSSPLHRLLGLSPVLDFLICLSLANLCYLPVWYKVIRLSLNPDAQWANYSEAGCWAALLGVFALTVVLGVGAGWIRRQGGGHPLLVECGRAALIALILHCAIALIAGEAPTLHRQFFGFPLASAKSAAGLVLTMAAGLFLWMARHRLLRLCRLVLLLLSPFAALTVGETGLLLTKFEHSPIADVLDGPRHGPKVLWLVFDELDHRALHSNVFRDGELPEFTRLRAEAFHATRAAPPADSTLLSMPSLIAGEVVSGSEPLGPSDRLLIFGSGKRARWSESPNVFSRARELGANSGLVGWYHPYCRVLGAHLTSCHYVDPDHDSIVAAVGRHLKLMARVSSFGLLDALRYAEISGSGSDVRRYREMLEAARALALDEHTGLVFVHWSIPHLPVVYSRELGKLGLMRGGDYFDNVALADRALGALRRGLEDAGLWDSMAVLVTSDHGLRVKRWDQKFPPPSEGSAGSPLVGAGRHVPFLLKLPNQRSAVEVGFDFNTVVSHDLVLGLISGDLRSPTDVTRWLEGRRSPAPIPSAH